MPRGLSTTLKNTLAGQNFIIADLVELDLDTPLYYTNAGHDIDASTDTSSGTQTYTAQGEFMSHTIINEREDPSINTISIVFSAVTSTFKNIALNDDFLHKDVRIYKAFFNASDLSVIDTPILWYQGKFTGASIQDSPDDSSVTFTTSNYFADFEYVSGRKTNNGSQQRFFPGDKFFDKSTVAIADVKWGKE